MFEIIKKNFFADPTARKIKGRPLKVRVKNTARVRLTDHIQEPTLRVDPRITDEFSSQTGEQDGPPDRDKTINPGACW